MSNDSRYFGEKENISRRRKNNKKTLDDAESEVDIFQLLTDNEMEYESLPSTNMARITHIPTRKSVTFEVDARTSSRVKVYMVNKLLNQMH